MRIARFLADGAAHFGTVTADRVTAVDHRVSRFADLVAHPDEGHARVGDAQWDVHTVRWLPPFDNDAKIICVGFNYASHATEVGRAGAARPTLFPRFPDSFVGSGEAVVRGRDAHALDWEGEAGLVIGTYARRVTPETALQYVAGVTCLAENSEREWQQHTAQVTAGKNWHASGGAGPWITTLEGLAFPLRVTTRLNDDVVQDDSTDHLSHDFAALISYISTFTPLRPGDVIATGTPAGIGFRKDPPRYLRPGDRLDVEVSGVGRLHHTVVDESTSHPGPSVLTSTSGDTR
ncbi:fumarylacetoacetate hydrolase family protein [Jatrophihabitans sp. YIM 134969]